MQAPPGQLEGGHQDPRLAPPDPLQAAQLGRVHGDDLLDAVAVADGARHLLHAAPAVAGAEDHGHQLVVAQALGSAALQAFSRQVLRMAGPAVAAVGIGAARVLLVQL